MKLKNKLFKKLFERLSPPLPLWGGLGVGLLLFVGSANLWARGGDPFPSVNIGKYNGTMTITSQVVQNGQVVTDAIVAVYCEDELRGKENVGSGTNPNLAYLTVYGNYTREPQYLYFKVYTGKNIFTYNPSPALTYTFYGSEGTESSPYIIDITPVSLANDADNSSVLTTYNDQTVDVALTGRTLYKDGKWNTLCLPFALSTEQITAHEDFAGATLMELDENGKNGFDTSDGTLYLKFKKATAITAGTPYLVKWDAAGTDFTSPIFCGVTIEAAAPTTVSYADDGLEEVQMVGCYSPVQVTANDKSILFLSDANTLYYSAIDRNIRSCRAYFSVPYIKQNTGTQARAFHLDFGEGEQTGIVTVHSSGPLVDGSDAWYTLNGKKLNGKPKKRGIYVNGGRKVAI